MKIAAIKLIIFQIISFPSDLGDKTCPSSYIRIFILKMIMSNLETFIQVVALNV